MKQRAMPSLDRDGNPALPVASMPTFPQSGLAAQHFVCSCSNSSRDNRENFLKRMSCIHPCTSDQDLRGRGKYLLWRLTLPTRALWASKISSSSSSSLLRFRSLEETTIRSYCTEIPWRDSSSMVARHLGNHALHCRAQATGIPRCCTSYIVHTKGRAIYIYVSAYNRGFCTYLPRPPCYLVAMVSSWMWMRDS